MCWRHVHIRTAPTHPACHASLEPEKLVPFCPRGLPRGKGKGAFQRQKTGICWFFATRLIDSASRLEQRGQCSARIIRSHERLPNQKRFYIIGLHERNVGRGEDAGLGDDYAAGREGNRGQTTVSQGKPCRRGSVQKCLGSPACFITAFAVWRDLILWSTGKRIPVCGLNQIS